MEYIETNEIHLHTRVEGDQNNPLIILLHGFPEFMKGWEKEVMPLVDAGYYVLVPDLRGYNLSSKPRGKKNYHMSLLIADIVGLIKWSGREKAIIAGHDWGGFIAWGFALMHPSKVEKLIIVNAPHPGVMAEFLKTNEEQQKKSSYIRRFQLPFLPEFILKRKDYTNMVRSLKHSSIKGTFSEEDIMEYKEAWKNSSLSGMLNYYRANSLASDSPPQRVKVQTLVIWGRNDNFLMPELAEASWKMCPEGSKVEYVEDATHWVLHEKPNEIIKLILDFL